MNVILFTVSRNSSKSFLPIWVAWSGNVSLYKSRVFHSSHTSRSVVLPAPLIPIKAVRTPGLKAPLTPFLSSIDFVKHLELQLPMEFVAETFWFFFNQCMTHLNHKAVKHNYLWHCNWISDILEGQRNRCEWERHSAPLMSVNCIGFCYFIHSLSDHIL